MKRRLSLLLSGLALASSLALYGCGPKEEVKSKEEQAQSLQGTGDYSGMPPEARKQMEESMKNAKQGPSDAAKGQ